jgi:hypothetical protein
MKVIISNLVYVLLGLAIAIIVLQNGCGKGSDTNSKPDTTRVIEHHWHEREIQPVYIKPTIYATTPGVIPEPYKPSDNCDTLKAQYSNLSNEHFAINSYLDTVRLDSMGYIVLAQDVYRNTLRPYSVKGMHKYPHTKEMITITKPAEKKFQLYAGFNIMGNQLKPVNGGAVGLIAKTKRDRVYKLNAGIYGKEIYYGIGLYWKIGKR